MKKALALVLFQLLFGIGLTTTVDAQTVSITKTGSKYHDSGCRYLKYSAIQVSLEDAINNGYGACSVCKPPRGLENSGTESGGKVVERATPSYSAPKASSSRCTATTKAGARCKRVTTNSSGRCWQH